MSYIRPDERFDFAQAVIENLELAKQRLTAYGWKRHSFGSEDEGFCLLGATRPDGYSIPLTGSVPWHSQVALEEQIEMDYPDAYPKSAAGWNDSQRDKRKVIRLINRTIKSLKEGKIRV